jgi:hypothetical protein
VKGKPLAFVKHTYYIQPLLFRGRLIARNAAAIQAWQVCDSIGIVGISEVSTYANFLLLQTQADFCLEKVQNKCKKLKNQPGSLQKSKATRPAPSLLPGSWTLGFIFQQQRFHQQAAA